MYFGQDNGFNLKFWSSIACRHVYLPGPRQLAWDHELFQLLMRGGVTYWPCMCYNNHHQSYNKDQTINNNHNNHHKDIDYLVSLYSTVYWFCPDYNKHNHHTAAGNVKTLQKKQQHYNKNSTEILCFIYWFLESKG